jgi:lipopolysaccharide export system protein LptC
MKERRSIWQFRLVVILLSLIALTLGSFWLLEVMRRAGNEFFPPSKRSEPDFYVENFNYVKLAKTGEAQYHFSGDRLTHNPQDGSYDITQPVVRNIGSQETPILVRADRARVNSDNSEVHLYDNVHVDRPASGDAQHMHMKSEYLLLLPNEEEMKTDRPVVITVGESILTGTGMVANNATRQYRLSSNVHGTYQVPAR